MVGQPEAVPGRRGDQSLRRVAARDRASRCCARAGCCGWCAAVLVASLALHVWAALALTLIRPARRGRKTTRATSCSRRATPPAPCAGAASIAAGLRRLPPDCTSPWATSIPISCRATSTTTWWRPFPTGWWRPSTSSPTCCSASTCYHGLWSFFQSLGWNNPRFNPWRRVVRDRLRPGRSRSATSRSRSSCSRAGALRSAADWQLDATSSRRADRAEVGARRRST